MEDESVPCRGRGRRAAEGQGDPVAERILSGQSSPADFSNRRRMERLRATTISNRNGGPAVARRTTEVLTGDLSVRMRGQRERRGDVRLLQARPHRLRMTRGPRGNAVEARITQQGKRRANGFRGGPPSPTRGSWHTN
jgi:hypothetical protein